MLIEFKQFRFVPCYRVGVLIEDKLRYEGGYTHPGSTAEMSMPNFAVVEAFKGISPGGDDSTAAVDLPFDDQAVICR